MSSESPDQVITRLRQRAQSTSCRFETYDTNDVLVLIAALDDSSRTQERLGERVNIREQQALAPPHTCSVSGPDECRACPVIPEPAPPAVEPRGHTSPCSPDADGYQTCMMCRLSPSEQPQAGAGARDESTGGQAAEPECWCPDEPGITTQGCPQHDAPAAEPPKVRDHDPIPRVSEGFRLLDEAQERARELQEQNDQLRKDAAAVQDRRAPAGEQPTHGTPCPCGRSRWTDQMGGGWLACSSQPKVRDDATYRNGLGEVWPWWVQVTGDGHIELSDDACDVALGVGWYELVGGKDREFSQTELHAAAVRLDAEVARRHGYAPTDAATVERERIAKSLRGILAESMCGDIASGVFGRPGSKP